MLKIKTIHFSKRVRQRGFDKSLVDFIYRLGDISDAKGKYLKYHFKKQTLKKLLKCKKVSREDKLYIRKNIERLAKKYLIVSPEGVLVTACNYA